MTYQLKLIQFLLLTLLLFSGFLFTNSAQANRNKGTIVVANRVSGDLTLIDVATDTATTIDMPSGKNLSEPMYVVYKRGYVFVGDRANNRVVVFDSLDWDVVDEMPAGSGVFHMWGQPHGKQLWVNNDIDNTITVFNTRHLNVITTIDLPADLVADGGKVHDVILDKRAAYVTMVGLPGDTDIVIKYNLRNFTEVARADVGKDPHVTLAPHKRTLYVSAQNSNEVRVFRRKDLTEITTIDIPGAHGIDITRNGRIIYTTNIADGGMNALYTINTRSNTVIETPVDTPYATPHNIVLTGRNKKLYVTHSGATSDKVSVFSVSKRNPEPVFLTDVTTGFNPFGIEFVPSRNKWGKYH
ncbi:MAG: YncE family protein [Methylococcales bacterium]|nr:YncE family protein [Methylococcales bacterium]